jgi:hypothetical protein
MENLKASALTFQRNVKALACTAAAAAAGQQQQQQQYRARWGKSGEKRGKREKK